MTDSRIAVIGMAVRLPGAEDVADLRWLLTHDSVEVDEVPPSRWARDHYLGDGDHQGTHHRGAFLQDPFSFDHEAFGLTAGDAVLLDPQQRVMLEVGARALEDAGYRSVRRRLDAGVFVGARMNSYGFDHGRGLAPTGSDGTGRPVPAALWGRSQNFVAAWLSDRLDLTGPSLVVDTACSSSLTAVWLACQSLAAGSCEIALVGGVDLLLDPLTFVLLSRTGALSPDGLCQTFDERANGYVPGEGAVALVLKPMATAVADGDLILGAIAGTGVNNDGRTMGVTTPNLEAQIALLDRVYGRIDPTTVQYVETHGTGTAIGDPIEVRALTDVFGRRGVATGSVALGSLKRRIGHLHSASGLAGLAKIVLCLRDEIVPGVPVPTVNPRLRLDTGPLHLPPRPRPWPAAPIRRAGVSGFGFGGTNAHVVAEAATGPAPTSTGAGRPAEVLALSADSPDVLRELVAQWVEFLPSAADEIADVLATARLGRPARAVRCAVAGPDADRLAAALRARLLHADVPLGEPTGRPPVVAVRPVAGSAPPRWLLALHHDVPAVREIVGRFETAVGSPVTTFSGPLLRICAGVVLAVALRDTGVPEQAVDLPPGWSPIADFTHGRTSLEQALSTVLAAGAATTEAPAPADGAVDLGARLAAATDGREVAAVLAVVAAELYEAGVDIDWATFQGPVAWRKRLLPVGQARGPALDLREPLRSAEPGGPLTLDDAGPAGFAFSRVFGPGEVPIAQHSVYRRIMLPGVAWFDFLRQGAELRGGPFHGVHDVLFHRPLIPTGAHRVVCRVDAEGRFTVADVAGTPFVTGRYAPQPDPVPAPQPLAALLDTCARVHAGSTVYRWLRRIGYQHGRYYRNISWVASLSGGGTLARIEGGRQRILNPPDVQLFPGLLDSVTIAAIDPDNPVFGTDHATAFIPLSVDRVSVHGALADAAYVRTEVSFWNEEACRVTQVVLDAAGVPLLTFGDISSKRVPVLAFSDPPPADTARRPAAGSAVAPVTAAAAVPVGPAVPAAAVSAAPVRGDAPVPVEARRPAAEPAGPAPEVPPAGGTSGADLPASGPVPTTPFARALAWFLALAGTDAEHVDVEFLSAGFDSVGLVGLSERLSREHGLSLYPTVFFEYPTPRSFAQHLVDEAPEFVAALTASPAPVAPDAVAPPPADTTRTPPVGTVPIPPPAAPGAARAGTASAAPPDRSVPVPLPDRSVPVPLPDRSVPVPLPDRSVPVPLPTGSVPTRPPAASMSAVAASPVAGAAGVSGVDGTDPGRDIAVVGAAIRVPTAGDLDAFWTLLTDGRDTVGALPEGRWQQLEGPVPQASFLDRVDEFDPVPFRISAREAPLIDPQARIVYETIWQALEDAGRTGQGSPDNRIGLWIAYSHDHYHEERSRHGVADGRGLGLEAMIPNRLSYLMDWHGPSVVVNTLCSSSLVALHTAVQHLRAGDIDTAVIGGVHAAISPEYFDSMRDLRALSPSFRCRAFDVEADGFVPGEGAVAIVLRRRADAERDADRIRGLIKGVAVNHGGRTTRYSAPSPAGQREVIVAALRDAGVGVDRIGMVEAHGTGTSLGDPIEVEGLTRAWRGFTSRTQFCAIGSLKSNIGHLEPAAGLAGLVKVLLSLEHGVVPPTLHVVRPNDHIRFEDTPFFVADQPVSWPRVEGAPRRAAVSAFGMGGVNAHVIVEEAPAPAVREPLPQQSHLVKVSAASEDGVRRLAGGYARMLSGVDSSVVGDVGFTANVGRASHRFRVAVQGADGSGLVNGLSAVAGGDRPVGRLSNEPPVSVFLFSGQGSQYPGMGAGLYATEPVFRAAFDECAELVASGGDVPLREVVLGGRGGELVQTRFAQVGIVSVQVGLVRLLESWGVRPGLVVGHSVGELTAAWAAGVLALPEVLRLAVVRGGLMQAQPSGGAMAVVFADAGSVEAVLPSFPGVEIAACNAPRSVTISGPAEAVEAFGAGSGLRMQRLTVSHAFHSAAMAGAVDPFAQAFGQAVVSPPRVGFASTVTGGWHDAGSVADGRLWGSGIRRPVRFTQAIEAVHTAGGRVFWEIGAHPVLTGLARATLTDTDLTWLPTLRRDHDDQTQLHTAITSFYNHGHGDLDWAGVHHGKGHRTTTIPTYPFERRELSAPRVPGSAAVRRRPEPEVSVPAAGDEAVGHPLFDRHYEH
ncbi:Acyl transferase domain-containing protein [Micromonospora matsumotoense]|uniref:Acyl transferase domain-containing protein n=1 Tax=Micromonospora matsumotoense TaxID=121616 RepID=A0A1C4UZ98_9ACTN|nr:type I polyketide synthase [Micromonospora matsumotoense]SCE77022.1 Acyl transferase domain-containing protein [Micromonospora matsumotoense]